MAKVTIKLDREREIKFGFKAIAALDDECKINLHATGTYSDFSPRKLRDLVWAGQLHTDRPLSRDKISEYLPTELEEFGEIALKISKAVRTALGINEPTEPTSEEAGN